MPGGTVTKYEVKPFRSTEPSVEKEKFGFFTSFEATTTVETSKSITEVAGSSIVMIAPCAPAVAGLAVTGTVTVLFSGSENGLRRREGAVVAADPRCASRCRPARWCG